MPIEEIVKVKLRGPGPLVVHTFQKLVIFMTKQKSPRQIFD